MACGIFIGIQVIRFLAGRKLISFNLCIKMTHNNKKVLLTFHSAVHKADIRNLPLNVEERFKQARF